MWESRIIRIRPTRTRGSDARGGPGFRAIKLCAGWSGGGARAFAISGGARYCGLVNQPFGAGVVLRSLLGRALPDWAAKIGCVSWVQILLKFVLGHSAVTFAILGTGRSDHMRDNARV